MRFYLPVPRDPVVFSSYFCVFRGDPWLIVSSLGSGIRALAIELPCSRRCALSCRRWLSPIRCFTTSMFTVPLFTMPAGSPYWTTHALTLDVITIPSINDHPMLATHVFLFFFPLSYIYQIFSSFLSEQVYFSIVQGAWAGMVSLAIFLIGYRAMNCWLLAVVSVVTGLNPFVFTSTSFPMWRWRCPRL